MPVTIFYCPLYLPLSREEGAREGTEVVREEWAQEETSIERKENTGEGATYETDVTVQSVASDVLQSMLSNHMNTRKK